MSWLWLLLLLFPALVSIPGWYMVATACLPRPVGVWTHYRSSGEAVTPARVRTFGWSWIAFCGAWTAFLAAQALGYGPGSWTVRVALWCTFVLLMVFFVVLKIRAFPSARRSPPE